LLTAATNLGPRVEMPEEIGAYLEAMFAGEREWLRNLLGESVAVYPQRGELQ
jgi:hypothetical protein